MFPSYSQRPKGPKNGPSRAGKHEPSAGDGRKTLAAIFRREVASVATSARQKNTNGWLTIGFRCRGGGPRWFQWNMVAEEAEASGLRGASTFASVSGHGTQAGKHALRRFAGLLARIFHSEVGQNHANPGSAGFQACRIAGFLTCVLWPFQPAFKRICAYIFIGFSHLFPNHYETSGLFPKLRVSGHAGFTRGGARGRG